MERQKGFTLIEMMFGLVVMGLVTLAAVGYLKNFSAQSKKIRISGTGDSAFRSFGQGFNVDLKGADIAMQFQHLPVPMGGCGLSGPCVLELKNEETFEAASGDILGGAEGVEFFADRNAKLLTRVAINDEAAPTKAVYTKPLSMKKVRKEGRRRFYAAWTLADESTKPFVMMTRGAFADYFTLVETYVASDPPSTAGRWVIFKASSSSPDMKAVNGALLAVYNGFDPTQYFIQKVTGTLNCKKAFDECKTIAKALNATADHSLLDDGGYYALKLDAVVGAGDFQPPVPDFGAWWSQPAAMYGFPSKVASIHRAGDPDFNVPIDARRLAHFFHASGVRAQVMAVPVHLAAYSLEKDKKGKTIKLMKETFPFTKNDKRQTALDDIPLGTKVIFGRQLGTSNVSVFFYKP